MIYLTGNNFSFVPLIIPQESICSIRVDTVTNDEILPIIHEKMINVVNMNSFAHVLSDRFPTAEFNFIDLDSDFRFNLRDQDVIILMVDVQNFVLIRKGG